MTCRAFRKLIRGSPWNATTAELGAMDRHHSTCPNCPAWLNHLEKKVSSRRTPAENAAALAAANTEAAELWGRVLADPEARP